MKKTTKYGRKLRQGGGWAKMWSCFNTIAACRQYSDEPILDGMEHTVNLSSATKSSLILHEAYEMIKNGESKDEIAFNMMIHYIDVAVIRAIEIAGNRISKNPMLPILVAATEACQRTRERYQKTKKMGFDGPAIGEIAAAIELYDTIITSGSPRQMTMAEELRADVLAGKRPASDISTCA